MSANAGFLSTGPVVRLLSTSKTSNATPLCFNTLRKARGNRSGRSQVGRITLTKFMG